MFCTCVTLAAVSDACSFVCDYTVLGQSLYSHSPCTGDSGAQIVDLLKKNPGVAIQVVLARLNQKDEEWRKVKLEMKPLFSKVFQQNYHKSLDHRSFYFKQTDKKQLGHKAMIQVHASANVFAVRDVEVHSTVSPQTA